MPHGHEPDPELEDLYQLHAKHGQLSADQPGHLTYRKALERIRCLQEEVAELTGAAATDDLPGVADALVDLVVFAKGTAVMLGLPWEALWDDVHRANLAKERGAGKRGFAVDLVKPPGWEGPRTLEILKEHGYDPDAWVTDDTVFGRDDE